MMALLMAAILLTPAVAAAGGSITFFKRSEVVGAEIKVDDVARVQGISDSALKARIRAITLGKSPAPMGERTLSRLSLEAALKQGGLPARIKVNYPTRMLVTRPGQKLLRAEAGRQIEAAIKRWLTSATQPGQTVKLKPLTWRSDLVLPKGEVTFVAKTKQGDGPSKTTMFTIEILVDGQMVSTRHLSARFDIRGLACVLQRALRSGEVISAADLREERAELSADSVSCREAAGQSVRSSLRAGSKLRRSSLKAPDLVRRGDLVMIVYESGGLRITGKGEARGAGARGDWIQVRNTMSGKLIKAKVHASGKVVVQ